VRRNLLLDLQSGQLRDLSEHGEQAHLIALDHTGSVVVTGDAEGRLRVAPAGGGGPHLLLGHEGGVTSVAIDPEGRWIASGGFDGTIRVWPMPDLSQPPLHTLPREELVAKLKSLTNLRLVRDADLEAGWRLTHDPFPGWRNVPSW
jgi:WD40 repeat protein